MGIAADHSVVNFHADALVKRLLVNDWHYTPFLQNVVY